MPKKIPVAVVQLCNKMTPQKMRKAVNDPLMLLVL